MKNMMFARIIALPLSLLLVQILLPAHLFASKAQRQSTAPELEGTIWEAEHPVLYSAVLGERLKRQFDCRFGKQGKVTCDVNVIVDGKLKTESKYDPIERVYKLTPVYVPSHKEPLLRTVKNGTYKQTGNSVHIIIPFAYKIDATVKGNQISGEVILVLDSDQKVPWVARRVSGESSRLSASDHSGSLPPAVTRAPGGGLRPPYAGQYGGRWITTHSDLGGTQRGGWTLSIDTEGRVTGKEVNTTWNVTGDINGSVSKDGSIELSIQYGGEFKNAPPALIKGRVTNAVDRHLKGTLNQYDSRGEVTTVIEIDLAPINVEP
jgi:hypothetical protein